MESAKKGSLCKSGIFYLMLFLMCITVIANKRNFHVDEIYTYGLSNNTGGEIALQPQCAPYIYEPAESAYIEYMTVQEGERFNFKNVWSQQEKDVHPPFYYVLIHMLSSVFIGSGSKWIPATINILFMLLTFWMVRKILCLFDCDEKEKDIISIFLILSTGMMQNLSFLRMYVMTMFMVTLCTYWILRFINEKCTLKFYVGISIIAIVGTLTHYYFLIYLFFISIFFGLYLLLNKRFSDALKYVFFMFVAGGGSYCIFPAMLKHIFGGYRGEQSFDNLRGGMGLYWSQLKEIGSYVDKDLFGGCLLMIICIGGFLLVSQRGAGKLRLTRFNTRKWMWCCLGGACIGYFLLVAKIAVYTASRYIYPIYAVSVILVVLVLKRFLDLILGQYVRASLMLWAMVLGIMTAGAHKDVYWGFLYLDSDSLLEKVKEYENVDCLYVYKTGMAWKAGSSYIEMKNYRRAVYFEDNVNKLKEMSDLSKESEFVLYIVDCNADAVISQIMEICPQINAYDELGSYAYATSYHLYGKDIDSEKGHLKNYEQTLFLNCEEDTGNIRLSENKSLIMTLKYKEVDWYNLYLQNGVVDLDHGVLKEGQNIQKFSPNGTDAQRWNLTENEDGTVTIYAYNSNFCLTYDDSGNIFISEYSPEQVRQKWWFQTE